MVRLVFCRTGVSDYSVDAILIIRSGLIRLLIGSLLCLLISGCVPIEEAGSRAHVLRLPVYHVTRGETLYSIAWRFRLDHKQVAWWNNIQPPFIIYRGQTLFLAPPPGKTFYPTENKLQPPQQVVIQSATDNSTSNSSSTQTRKPQVVTHKPPKPAIVKSPATTRRVSTSNTKPIKIEQKKIIEWSWPAKGKVIARFDRVSGLNISGKEGQPVVASASGKVVYSGNGLKGYGQLIIIKHDDKFLSAYAHNKRVLVNQGDRVFSGQKIAEMGNTTTGAPQLHFEIRRNGEPVDPEKYLPGYKS